MRSAALEGGVRSCSPVETMSGSGRSRSCRSSLPTAPPTFHRLRASPGGLVSNQGALSRPSGARESACAPDRARDDLPAEVSRDRGQGAFARPAPSVAIARERKLRPDPISSDTSCRELVAVLAGEANTAAASSLEVGRIRAHHAKPACAGQRRRPAFAGPSRRAAGRACQLAPCDPLTWSRRRQGRLPRSSAKRSAIRCARGAFRRWIPLS